MSAINTNNEEPKGIVFSNADIFGKGFTSSVKNDGSIVTKLLSFGVLQFNGMIDTVMMSAIEKKHLWLYIRYLWISNYQNPDLYDEFDGMANQTSNGVVTASAHGFVNKIYKHLGYIHEPTVEGAAGLTKEHLADFINSLILKYKTLEIPILSNIFKLVLDKISKDVANTEVPDTTNTEEMKPGNVTTSLENNSLKINIKI
jgi:hypothetical protein